MRLNTFILSACIGWLVCACSDQELSTQQGETTAPIALSASINGSMQAGSRVDDEPVEVSTGDYYLTYTPTDSNSTQTVYTIFSDGTGYPYLSTTGTTRTRLNWGHVKNESGQCTLYLDNVPDENAEGTTIELGDSYKAGPYTGENCEGDILWGKYNKTYDVNPLSIDLYHRMASIKVHIEAEDPNVEGQMTQPITVSLSNIKTKAGTFNRLNGIVIAANEKPEDGVTIHSTVLDTNGDTDVFLFPPQKFPTGNRPQLTIVLSDGTTYRGTLPEIMHINNGSSITDPNLELKAGYLLTINVKLVQSVNEQVIEFLPAVVEDWVEKVIVPIPSKQVGITNNEEYKAVVEAYNKLYDSGTSEEEKATCRETLERYATYNEETEIWTICFFATLTLESGETTFLKFSNGDHLMLDFRGHTIYDQESKEGLIETNTTTEEEVEP